jgi:hypothetical protein
MMITQVYVPAWMWPVILVLSVAVFATVRYTGHR